MNYENLIIEKKDQITICTLNRPQALNALNANILNDLDGFLKTLDQDQKTKIVILTGAGEKAFVAGADIKEISGLNKKSAHEFSLKGQGIFRRLESLSQVFIGAINGFALGGGLELALSCDFLIANARAKFGLPEVSLGLIPGFGGTQRLARLIGLARAREMIYSGNHVTAQEALQMGLVNHVVDGSCVEEALKLAAKILDKSFLGISHAKRSINNGYDMTLDDGLNLEAKEFSELFGSQDTKEGLSAFIEKRKPNFG